MKIAVFASGSGSNCRVLYERIQSRDLNAELSVIISNESEAGVIQFAREKGIRHHVLSSKDFSTLDSFQERMLQCLRDVQAEFIVLAGYMKRLGRPILQAFPNAVLNIHPALLPAFGGKGMYGLHVHEAVLAYGAKLTGITIHLVDEEYDRGPVLLQKAVQVDPADTPQSLAAKVQALEHAHYFQVVGWFADRRVVMEGRHVTILPKSQQSSL